MIFFYEDLSNKISKTDSQKKLRIKNIISQLEMQSELKYLHQKTIFKGHFLSKTFNFTGQYFIEI